MKRHKYYLLIIIFLSLITAINAQQEELRTQENKMEGKVLIDESSIISIAAKLQQIKKQIDEKQSAKSHLDDTHKSYLDDTHLTSKEKPLETALLEQEIVRLKDELSYYQSLSKLSPGISINNDYYNAKLNDLQNQVFELRKLMVRLMDENNKSNIVTVPTNKDTKADDLKPKNSNNPQQIIKHRIDTLYIASQNSNKKDSLAYINQISMLKKQLQEITDKIDKPTSNLAIDKEITVTLPIKDLKRKLFFENNSYVVKETDLPILLEIANLLKEHENFDVLIKGFASNKGTPVYNENLSLLRTESVKKALVSIGIHPSRILTQYHGIDYAETNEVLTRRVDVSLLLRK